MKRTLTQAIIIIALLTTISLQGQVTMGSGQPPAPGALLDLKMDGATTKGLALPRVKLSDRTKLKIGTAAELTGAERDKHTGLLVYNVSGAPIPKCALIPDGIYIWDGETWQGINIKTAELPTLTLSGADIYFPSGRDARTLPSTPETFTASWTPTDNPAVYTNTPHATWGGISFNGADTPPASGNLTTTPAAFSLLPNAMTAAEIAANPFRTKQNTLTFKVANECGTDITEVRIINQTNKALTLSTPTKEYTATTNATNTLTANANWKVTQFPVGTTNAISTLQLDGNTLPFSTDVTGYERNDNQGTGTANNLSYTVTVSASKARYSYLIFEDANNPKRFDNVALTVLQCTNVGQQPSIEQWALFAGFSQAEIDAVKGKTAPNDGGLSSRILSNGVQLHLDQSDNLFLSSNFGTNPKDSDMRWMIHNLAATKFDTGQNYTGAATLANKQLRPYNADGVPPGTPATTINNNAYKNPYYAYPNGGTNNGSMTTTTYTQNPRLGLLYTWDAATAGKGGNTGQLNMDGAIQESGRREGTATTEQKRRQGICPNGWHLPSDDEWSLLEQEIVKNKNTFSSLPTSTGSALTAELTSVDRAAAATTTTYTGNTSYRGLQNDVNGHGNAMKEICEPGTGNFKGASNGLSSTARPGMDVFLAGHADGGSAYGYGSLAYFWSASSYSATTAWFRIFGSGNSQVGRNATNRRYLFSVRCKKD
ncbi:FISUMP domain-containing protein [Dysgonomonas sp. 25]|uniref:FISUMP domain-containing protein n=1 Tax=Dysgonomonas sp. 25 TaxID=2302933 RepID=UPI0013D2E729|nr:FISUMP domain-containing protein [Dysgonomonas sp. 25]NDV68754.1 hypothetical protein [Dysgonomonas sp. 25]